MLVVKKKEINKMNVKKYYLKNYWFTTSTVRIIFILLKKNFLSIVFTITFFFPKSLRHFFSMAGV